MSHISCDRGSPFYTPEWRSYKIFLAGSERWGVIEADEEGRFARQFRMDEFGNFVEKEGHPGEYLIDEFHGSVRIEREPPKIEIVISDLNTEFLPGLGTLSKANISTQIWPFPEPGPDDA